MFSRTRGILLIITLFLLCCSAAPHHQPRQKRGLVKMMMHIMWDPVRLIRYWYAYDVTKEIAKSWRKIIPTMILHPHLADTPGISKYLNPTHGLTKSKRTSKHQFVYPDSSSAETYSADTQFSDDYLQTLVEQPDHSKNAYFKFAEGVTGTGYGMPHQQVVSESTSNVNSVPALYRQYFKFGNMYGGKSQNVPVSSIPDVPEEFESHRGAHHVYLQPGHQFVNDANHERSPTRQSVIDNGYEFPAMQPGLKPVPLPYKIAVPNSSGEQHIVLKAIPVSSFHSSTEVVDGRDHAASSSSNVDSTRLRDIYFESHPGQFGPRHPSFVQSYPNYKPRVTYVENNQDPQAGHQEIHIVLHPIPIGSTDQRTAAVAGGQAVHYVPYNFNSNESSNPSGGHFSFTFPTIQQTTDSATSHEEHSVPPPEHLPEFHTRDDNTSVTAGKNESRPDNSSSLEDVYDAKQTSRVTWVLQQEKSFNRPKDAKLSDNASDGSVPKISSLDIKYGSFKHIPDYSDYQSQHPLRLNGQHIDIEQLREDLKHGTPVLIPFNKKVKLAPKSEKSVNNENPFDIGQLNIRGEFQYDSSNLPKGSLILNEKRTFDGPKVLQDLKYSPEEHGANNSTQKLLLFLAKKHTSQYHM